MTHKEKLLQDIQERPLEIADRIVNLCCPPDIVKHMMEHIGFDSTPCPAATCEECWDREMEEEDAK